MKLKEYYKMWALRLKDEIRWIRVKIKYWFLRNKPMVTFVLYLLLTIIKRKIEKSKAINLEMQIQRLFYIQLFRWTILTV